MAREGEGDLEREANDDRTDRLLAQVNEVLRDVSVAPEKVWEDFAHAAVGQGEAQSAGSGDGSGADTAGEGEIGCP